MVWADTESLCRPRVKRRRMCSGEWPVLGSISKCPLLWNKRYGKSEFGLRSWGACSEMSGNYKWKLVRKAIAPAFSTANLKCALWSFSLNFVVTVTAGMSLLRSN